MADKKLSALTDADTPLAGDELIYVVQDGNSRKVATGSLYIPGGTDVAVSDGGTGASNASDARDNLGLTIGADVQAYSATLDAIAQVSPESYGLGLLEMPDAASAQVYLDLAPVAASGDYDDLDNKPTLGTMAAEDASNYTPTSGLAAVALSNDYTDLDNLPSLAPIATSGDFDDLTNVPTNVADLADLTPGTDGQVVGWQSGELATFTAPGSGDMLASMYDPNGVEADAFDSANHAYDNTGSGLSATNVQDAIDKIASVANSAVLFEAQSLNATQQAQVRANIGLGSSATEDSSAFATAAQGAKADTAVQSVVAGANVTVDATDPQNPIISASGGAGPDFATVADLLADNNGKIGYAGSGADTEVQPGEIVTAQGFRYEVAASDAVDAHVATAGGVKLYVLTQHKRLYAAAFGLEPDTGADVTVLAQKIIDALPSEKGITLVIPAGRYKVSKNTALDNYPGNDQPCLEFRSKKDFRVEADGAVFFCETHAQGVFEFQLCEDGEIVGLRAEGAGNFPPLDGTTGRGEKGISNAGYHTSGFQGYYKNNSYDTSANTGGGYGGAFPQWGGGTASTWGMWNGGYIGNTGSGFLVHNGCKRLTFRRCGARLFNRAGLQIGFMGDFSPVDRGYAPNEDIRSYDCNWDENYDSGVDYSDVTGGGVWGGSTSRNGHPDANPATDENFDPGYGSTARSMALSVSDRIARDFTIEGVQAEGNKRKGIDVHSGKGIIISKNKVRDNIWAGIAAVGNGSAGHPATDILISDNDIEGGWWLIAMLGADGQPSTGGRILGNRAKSSDIVPTRGGIYVYDVDGCIIADNQVEISNYDSVNGLGGIATNIAIRTKNASFHGNHVKMGASGIPYDLSAANGLCYGNTWEGGDQPPIIKPGTKRSLAVADTLAFTVTFNGTATPTVSDVVGGDISVSATSIAQGVSFSFSGARPSNTGLHCAATVEILTSGGLATSGGTAGVIYTRAISASALDLGIKSTWGGGHIQASDLVSGSMRVTVLYR